MEKKNTPAKIVKPVKRDQAPIDENPLAKPETSKKDITVKKDRKTERIKDDDWKI
jgi:hypothetical protein